MLSYRHAFHAGNHADILKHAVLSYVLSYMGQKDKPFVCIDTHAGAGIYDLDGEWAQKTGEAEEGILRLVAEPDAPAFFNPYLSLCRNMIANGRRYPGSPELERSLCRQQDSIVLMELHNTEIDILRNYFGGEKKIHIHHRDGFSGLEALCPPEPRRGLAIVDPSYETVDDYEKAATTLLSAHRKWPAGTLILWYPILERRQSELLSLKDRFAVSGIPGILSIELVVDASNDEGFGLAGSGLLLIQPPWTLAGDLDAALPWLAGLLGKNGNGTASIRWLTEPS